MFALATKSYLRLGLAAVLVAGLAYSHSFMYRAGKRADTSENLKAIKEHQLRIDKLNEELSEEKQRIRIEYHEKIKEVRVAEDPTGCADTNVPADILHQLGGDPAD